MSVQSRNTTGLWYNNETVTIARAAATNSRNSELTTAAKATRTEQGNKLARPIWSAAWARSYVQRTKHTIEERATKRINRTSRIQTECYGTNEASDTATCGGAVGMCRGRWAMERLRLDGSEPEKDDDGEAMGGVSGAIVSHAFGTTMVGASTGRVWDSRLRRSLSSAAAEDNTGRRRRRSCKSARVAE